MAEPASGRRRRRLLRLGLGAVVLAWLAIATAMVLGARADAEAGRAATDRAKAQVSPDDVLNARPLPSLREAHDRFSRAHRRLGHPLVAPLKLVPILGRQLRSVDALSVGASRVADVGVGAVEEAQIVLEAPHSTGPERVDVMRRLSDVAASTNTRLDGIDLGPSQALVGPVARAHDDFAAKLSSVRDGLTRGAAGARAAAELLNGPSRYLVLAANNSEMRAGSGMLLEAGVLTTTDGHLEMGPLRPSSELALPPGKVPATGDLADRWGWMKPTEDLRFLAASPRFDVTAPLAARMWDAAGGGQVDGVIAVDPEALRAVLAVTGSVDVNGRTISADNVVDFILHDQYLAYAGDPAAQARKDELGTIARAAITNLQDRQWSPSKLARELGPAARGRHVLAWSSRPGEQAAWQAAGIDGGLRGNDLMAATMSTGGNKLDRFLRVDSALSVRHTGATWNVTVRVRLRNQGPAGEPPYVAGPSPGGAARGLGPGDYSGIVSVSLPGSAEGARMGGTDRLVAAGPDGPTQVVATEVTLRPAQEHTVEVVFDLPASIRALDVRPSARIPPVPWTFGREGWTDDSTHRVTW